ncbi:MAG: hypothetical protein NZ528_09955 [Caldilineales bacterium]|nr:hypothetical protein [Caldilineales bacterium]MDW8316666.1 lysylphosphatidylglycerol synthase domain-containing protein [Anaerolineae bacterium]
MALLREPAAAAQEAGPPAVASRPAGRWKKAVRLAAVVASLGFLAALVISQWQELRAFPWTLRPAWLVLSLGGLLAAWLVELSIWRFLLAGVGGALSWRRAAQVWFYSNLVRYIPGNIWQFLGMAELAADSGVGRLTTFTSIALHQALSTAVGLVVAAVYFAAAGQGALLEAVRPALWLVPLGLVFCHPRLLEWLLNQALRLLRRPPVQVTLTWQQVAAALLGYLGVWLIMGGAFALLAASVTSVGRAEAPALVATWAAAYVIGYLSLLTPSGLGVREGVMVLLLTPILPAPAPTVVALAARLWMVAGELLGVALAVLLGRRRGAEEALPPPVRHEADREASQEAQA